MMRLALMMVSIVLALAGLPAKAHHSTTGIYNELELIELTGTVREWRFVNPHPSLVIDVIGPNGDVQEWDVSYGGAAVTHLSRRGYAADTFMPGDVVVVRGFAALVDSAYGLLVRGDPVMEDGSPILSAQP